MAIDGYNRFMRYPKCMVLQQEMTREQFSGPIVEYQDQTKPFTHGFKSNVYSHLFLVKSHFAIYVYMKFQFLIGYIDPTVLVS